MLTDVYVEYLNGCLRRSARSSHHDIGRVTGSSVSHTAKIPPGVRIGRPGLFQFLNAAPAPIISRILNWALAKGRSFFWRPVCPAGEPVHVVTHVVYTVGWRRSPASPQQYGGGGRGGGKHTVSLTGCSKRGAPQVSAAVAGRWATATKAAAARPGACQ